MCEVRTASFIFFIRELAALELQPVMQRVQVVLDHLQPQQAGPTPAAKQTSWKPEIAFNIEMVPLSLRPRHAPRDLSARVPVLSLHGDWRLHPDRPDPITLLMKTNEGRQAHLVPLRMARMAASQFAFLRGADALMAFDLSKTPTSGVNVMIDGDAHLRYRLSCGGVPQRCSTIAESPVAATLAFMARQADNWCGI